ncbi:MAG: hypothetical protein F9K29_22430 [Hyphomicrobiaceae bacterium]|nr:MAG: hypothetical protein F9K29_22430 [Hyphomicrobiaceae bacterium]
MLKFLKSLFGPRDGPNLTLEMRLESWRTPRSEQSSREIFDNQLSDLRDMHASLDDVTGKWIPNSLRIASAMVGDRSPLGRWEREAVRELTSEHVETYDEAASLLIARLRELAATGKDLPYTERAKRRPASARRKPPLG